MNYILSLSGGVASAVAAERAIQRYGRNRVTLWFADVLWEGEDNYRFINDCMQRWGGRLYTYRDGRTPLQVAEDKSIIPNQKHAPCSLILKVQPFTAWLWRQPKPVTVLIGLDWKEQHRIDERNRWHRKAGKTRPPTGYAKRVHGVYEDYPLNWRPIEFRPYQEVVRSWGIEPPRMYAAGFPHANCGGRCVKQGVKEWHRLRHWQPARFAEVRDWEQAQRAKGGARATYAIARDARGGEVKPLTLAELEAREMPADTAPSQDDMFGCMCSY